MHKLPPSSQSGLGRALPPAAATVLALAALCGASVAQAGEVYAGIGVPGLSLGYAHPLSPSAGVRVDYTTLSSRNETRVEDGITYRASLKANRVGAFGDWFVTQSNFRLTGGITSNNYKIDLNGGGGVTGAGSTITIGSTSYTLAAGDRFDVRIKFPRTTPYLGFGWGHQQAQKGWGFNADVGASIGKAKVTTTVSGALAAQVSQADINAETQQLRDDAGKVRAIPQLSVGVSYRF